MKQWQINPRLIQKEALQRCKLGECRGACCLYGVWVDKAEQEKILSHADIIQQNMPVVNRKKENWFTAEWEEDPFTESGLVVHTNVIEKDNHYGGTACIFYREDAKCALQVASMALGQHKWYLKPFYCILHPLDLDENGRITLDDAELLLDEAGSCVRPAVERVGLWETFEEELRYFLGGAGFEEFLLQAKRSAN